LFGGSFLGSLLLLWVLQFRKSRNEEDGGCSAVRAAFLVLEVYGDSPMCNRCDKILPYVGLELGNPTVTFVGPSGTRDTMRDGRWVD
jgi:hypothetical protein